MLFHLNNGTYETLKIVCSLIKNSLNKCCCQNLNKDTMAPGCTFFMIYINSPLDSALRKAHYFVVIIPLDL